RHTRFSRDWSSDVCSSDLIMFDYDKKTDTWYVTTDLATGEIKFRLNNKWDWNLGGALDGLTQGGDNIAVEAGNYTITLTVTGDKIGRASCRERCEIVDVRQ